MSSTAKWIFFDIDGTLWDEKQRIPDSTVRTIRALRENGHKCFICSGRARGNMQAKHLFDIGFDGVVAACGNFVELDGEVLYNHLLPEDVVRRTIEVTRRCNMPVVLEGPKDHWISEKGFESDPYIDYLYELLGDAAHPLRGYEEGIEMNKFSADIFPDTDYETIKRELGDVYDFLEHEGIVVEMIPKGTGKATGIKWLCEHLGIPVEDTYAVGDSVNDLDMLQFVGHSIAMGNGTQVAKDAAEYVTTGLWEDGIQKAMEHYGLVSLIKS